MMSRKFFNTTLGILLAIVAVNAFGGGIYGMSGADSIPKQWLSHSIFDSYFVPGLILFFVVGGFSLFGSIQIFRQSGFAITSAFLAGLILMFWVLSQVAIIGYVSWLQPAMAIFAIAIIILAYLLKRK
jgi:hypothetical protein